MEDCDYVRPPCQCHPNQPSSSPSPLQRKLYKKMEDNAYVYRSMYAQHLSNWLRHFPPSQLLLLPSEAVFAPASVETQFKRLAEFLGIDYAAANPQALFTASPASTSAAPHENGREYVAHPPPVLLNELRRWLCAHNTRLGELMLANGLASSKAQLAADMPWTQQEQPLSGCGG
jgi:hypothetical protein